MTAIKMTPRKQLKLKTDKIKWLGQLECLKFLSELSKKEKIEFRCNDVKVDVGKENNLTIIRIEGKK